MTVMEPRVKERRKTVSEDRARRRLKWILGVIALVGVVVGTMWLIRSPVLSIRQVDVVGAENSDPQVAVRSLAMGIGTPTIDVDGRTITAAILADPWVRSATVEVVWPGSVLIDVVERVPVALVLSADRWMLVGSYGGVIEEVASPGSDMPFIAIDAGAPAPGTVMEDDFVLGALAFAGRLTEPYRSEATIRIEGEGLAADVAGHAIRLGRPVDMVEKADVLIALLGSGIPEGSSIDLIAPLRPAITNPQPQQEGED